MNLAIHSNYFLKKEEKQILELALEVYSQSKTPRELITEAFKLLQEKALQAAREKEMRVKQAEAEMDKIHELMRQNKEFMNLQPQDLDNYFYGKNID